MPRSPTGPIEDKWDQLQRAREAGQPEQQAQASRSSSWARAWPAPRRPPRWPSSGYNVKVFTFHDSPRRAHSIAAQGGINAAKNYQGDGDSIYRLFYDTVKGGDYRSRESQRLPAGRGERRHHRPVRGPGRAVRPRVRRPPRQPLVRRRAGEPHLLRPRPDRPAAAPRRLPGAGPPGRRSAPSSCTPARRCSTSWWSTAAPPASSCATW